MTHNVLISAITERLNCATIIVVGDVMLDRFIDGTVERISPEAPIPVFSVTHETSMLGAAGNVVRNIAALGGTAYLYSAIGNDQAGAQIRDLIINETQTESGLITVPGRRTSIKTRYIASGQQIMRADREMVEGISSDIQETIINSIAKLIKKSGALLLSDYGKGVLLDVFTERLIGMAVDAKCPVIVDPKGKNYRCYGGAQVVTPNQQELAIATNMSTEGDEAVISACRKLISEAGIQGVLATRSEQGMTLVDRNGVSHFPANAREIFDVSGAGDTVAAAVALALSVNATLSEAAQFANTAAGVVVGKVGTAVARPQEILSAVNNWKRIDKVEKVLSLAAASERVANWRRLGLRIVPVGSMTERPNAYGTVIAV